MLESYEYTCKDEFTDGIEDGYSNVDPPPLVNCRNLPIPVSPQTTDNITTARNYYSH